MRLATRLALLTTAALLTALGLATVPVWTAIEGDAVDDLSGRLVSQAQLVASGVVALEGDPLDAGRLAQRSARALGSTVVILDRNGQVLAQGAAAGLRFESYANRPEVAAALRGQPAPVSGSPPAWARTFSSPPSRCCARGRSSARSA